jgi:hypothetical protein
MKCSKKAPNTLYIGNYVVESGTTRVVLRWEGCVRAARVSERAGLFRVGARVLAGGGSTTGGAGGAGLYALPVQVPPA